MEATPDGRNLRLHVAEGIDDFIVLPLPARRGKALSEAFLRIAMSRFSNELNLEPLTMAEMEATFVEAIGVDNYERAAGVLIDPDTFQPVAELPEDHPDYRLTPDGEAIRQEELQQLFQAAFYWQSVVGMKGVQALLEGEEGQGKALAQLLVMLGLSLSPTSPNSGSANPTPTPAGIPTTTTRNGGKTSVRLPAVKRSGSQNPAKKKTVRP